MHTKQTVKYICEKYPSGNQYYYKKEVITHDNWKNLQSLTWSRPRPISEKTFIQRKNEGYTVEVIIHKKKPAEIIPFIKKK
ncbi:hypothetical protein [Bacillus alkalicellulosilyticus]|uniref:hypothetical protein n=1 Tax=Alkalihalobacterium alkalicellulosilyticum TaxID=1912214 RepID=UPI000996CEB7|nr:hypothetical protein [Bacillus alkalicellulosilyticus]